MRDIGRREANPHRLNLRQINHARRSWRTLLLKVEPVIKLRDLTAALLLRFSNQDGLYRRVPHPISILDVNFLEPHPEPSGPSSSPPRTSQALQQEYGAYDEYRDDVQEVVGSGVEEHQQQQLLVTLPWWLVEVVWGCFSRLGRTLIQTPRFRTQLLGIVRSLVVHYLPGVAATVAYQNLDGILALLNHFSRR